MKRHKSPSVTIKDKHGVCKIDILAGHFWEYELDYDSGVLILYIGEAEWEYDIPKWINEGCHVLETDKMLLISKEEL